MDNPEIPTQTNSYLGLLENDLKEPKLKETGTHTKESTPYEYVADKVIGIVGDYANGTIEGPLALTALRIVAQHSLKHLSGDGYALWPNILATTTQIAIAERAKIDAITSGKS